MVDFEIKDFWPKFNRWIEDTSKELGGIETVFWNWKKVGGSRDGFIEPMACVEWMIDTESKKIQDIKKRSQGIMEKSIHCYSD